MLINVFFNGSDTDADLIEIPSSIIPYLDNVLKCYWSWLFDKSNDHDFWVLVDGEKSYCCYRSDAFVFWLNNRWLINHPERARVVEMCANQIESAP